MVVFGGIQFRDVKSGDLIDIIQYVRHNTKFKLINTIIWYYKNEEIMIMIMLDVARTSLKMLGTDLFEQLSKR